MKKIKNLMILLLAVVMAVSVVLTSGFALSLPESAALKATTCGFRPSHPLEQRRLKPAFSVLHRLQVEM